jgi:6,7-dimethyl-8-ribityllumazine synthase
MSGNLRSANSPDVVPDGAGRRVALVCSRFNDLIVERLERGARRALVEHGVLDDAIDTFWVPGALEIPQAARAAVASGRFDAVVALGAVVRGDTYHFEVVSDASAAGLMQLSLDAGGVVITNAILTVDDETQAIERAGDDDGNKGAQAAVAALATLDTLEQIVAVRSASPRRP